MQISNATRTAYIIVIILTVVYFNIGAAATPKISTV